jgi:pyruvate/2-oxoacid:ferredoxin oxidoreductase beta subunit
VLVVATLLVISVRKIIIVAIAKTKINGWTNFKIVNPCPIHIPKPVPSTCEANERPPPKSIRRPHGSFACFIPLH